MFSYDQSLEEPLPTFSEPDSLKHYQFIRSRIHIFNHCSVPTRQPWCPRYRLLPIHQFLIDVTLVVWLLSCLVRFILIAASVFSYYAHGRRGVRYSFACLALLI